MDYSEVLNSDFEFKMYHDSDAILHKATEEVSPFLLVGKRVFVDNMFNFMRANNGIGLAAPQIGLPLKFFIMHAPMDKPRVCINPIIQAKTEKQSVLKEGCLSYPGLYLTLKRPESVLVSYHDLEGNLVWEQLNDYAARVFQHEYDHLRGKVFTEYAGPTKLKLAKSKIKSNMKKRIKTSR